MEINFCRSQRKISEYGEKLVECCVEWDSLELCHKIKETISSGDLRENVVTALWTAVASIGLKEKKPSLELTEIVITKDFRRRLFLSYTFQVCEALEILVSNTKTRTREYYIEYLKILHKQGKLEKLLENAEELHQYHTYDSTLLEWICKIYNESKIEETGLCEKLKENISDYSSRLLNIHSDSSMGLFTIAVQKCDKMQFSEAADLLQKGTYILYLDIKFSFLRDVSCFSKTRTFTCMGVINKVLLQATTFRRSASCGSKSR